MGLRGVARWVRSWRAGGASAVWWGVMRAQAAPRGAGAGGGRGGWARAVPGWVASVWRASCVPGPGPVRGRTRSRVLHRRMGPTHHIGWGEERSRPAAAAAGGARRVQAGRRVSACAQPTRPGAAGPAPPARYPRPPGAARPRAGRPLYTAPRRPAGVRTHARRTHTRARAATPTHVHYSTTLRCTHHAAAARAPSRGRSPTPQTPH